MLNLLKSGRISFGVWFGVPVLVHWTVFLFLGVLWHCAAELTFWGSLLSLISIIPHEFGHIFAARYYGIRCRRILLTPLGGMAVFSSFTTNSMKEIVIALAGPAVSLCLALWSLFFAWVMMDVTLIPAIFCVSNFGLFLFNMMPLYPMDFGRVVRALMALFVSYEDATILAVRLCQGLSVFMVTILAFGHQWLGIGVIGSVALLAEVDLRMMKKTGSGLPLS